MLRRTLAALLSAALAVTGLAAGAVPAQATPATASVAVRVVTQHDAVVTQSIVNLWDSRTGRAVGAGDRGADGWTRFGQLAPGTYRAEIHDYLGKPSERSRTVEVAAGESARLTMTITAAQTISGRVTLGTEPVPRVKVSARYADGGYAPAARADADGRYTLVLNDGSYTLQAGSGTTPSGVRTRSVYSGGTDTREAAAKIRVAPGAHIVHDLAVSPAGAGSILTGRVVDGAGRGVPGIVVHAERLANGKKWHGESGADGAFSVEVRGGGDYRLQFADQSSWSQPSFATTVRTTTVAKGQTLAVGSIRLARAAGWGTSSVVVKVKGTLGDEDSPSMLHLRDARGRIVDGERMYDDLEPNRTAVFSDLAPGRYRAVFPATGQSVAVTVGAQETARTQLRIKAPKKRGNLTVRIVDGRGRSVSADAELTDRHGRLVGFSWPGTFGKLPAGRYTVSSHVAGRVYQKSVVVRHGRTTTTTLRAKPSGATVAGSVRGVRGTAFVKVILKGVGSTKARYETTTNDDRYVFRGVKPGRYRVVVQDVSGGSGLKYTIGGLPDAYYGGSTYQKSRIVRVKDGRTTRLGAVTLRR